MCLLQGTNLSEGRGTTKAFASFGAPWLEGEKLADALRAEKLPGVSFRPCSFTPTWDKHKGQRCHGVQIHIDYARGVAAVRTGLAALVQARAQDPAQFRSRTERDEFVAGSPPPTITASFFARRWQDSSRAPASLGPSRSQARRAPSICSSTSLTSTPARAGRWCSAPT